MEAIWNRIYNQELIWSEAGGKGGFGRGPLQNLRGTLARELNSYLIWEKNHPPGQTYIPPDLDAPWRQEALSQGIDTLSDPQGRLNPRELPVLENIISKLTQGKGAIPNEEWNGQDYFIESFNPFLAISREDTKDIDLAKVVQNRSRILLDVINKD